MRIFFCHNTVRKFKTMKHYSYYNPNPTGKNVGDCTVRALTKALRQSWEDIYIGLIVYGYMMKDMPSANAVWGAYLRNRGYARKIMPDTYSDCYTLLDFAKEKSIGTYVVALSGHVVCVQDGVIYDSWDSSGEVPLYYWYRRK